MGTYLDLVGLLDISQGSLAIGMVNCGFEDPVFQFEGQDHLADGEVAGNGFGGDIHIQIEGVEFLEGKIFAPGDGLDDGFLIDQATIAARKFEVEGGDYINHVRVILVDFSFLADGAEKLLAHLAFLEKDKLLLFGGENTQINQKVEKFIAVQKSHRLASDDGEWVVCPIVPVDTEFCKGI
jgi:hypothetical protein